MEFYAAERKELLPFTTARMELESIMLSEVSQVVKDKYHKISPILQNLYQNEFQVYSRVNFFKKKKHQLKHLEEYLR